MRATSHGVDARFLIISLTSLQMRTLRGFCSELRGSGAFWTALWSLAIVWKHWRWALCTTLVSPTGALCMSDLAVRYHPLMLTMPGSSKTCGCCGCSVSYACVMTTIQG